MNINQLAEQLGVAVEYIVDVYTKRAWTLWLDTSFYLALLVTMLVYLGFKTYQLAKKERQNKINFDDFLTCCVFNFLIFVLCFISPFVALVNSFDKLLQATHSPEAYAIEEVVRNFDN